MSEPVIRMLLVEGRTEYVSCDWRYDQTRDMMVLVRRDTQTFVHLREAARVEKQRVLPGVLPCIYQPDQSGGLRGPVRRVELIRIWT